MWRVKTVTKFKNSFSPVLIYWNANRIHLGIIEKLNFPIWFPPLINCINRLSENLKKWVDRYMYQAKIAYIHTII